MHECVGGADRHRIARTGDDVTQRAPQETLRALHLPAQLFVRESRATPGDGRAIRIRPDTLPERVDCVPLHRSFRRGRRPGSEHRLLVLAHGEKLLQRRFRICDEAAEQLEEAVTQRRRGTGQEEIGVVLNTAFDSVRHFDEPQVDVFGRALLHDRNTRVVQLAPVRATMARILKREHHLIESRRLLRQHLERNVLVCERFGHVLADLANPVQRGVRHGDGQTQRHHVVEEAHRGFQLRRRPAPHRNADGGIRIA